MRGVVPLGGGQLEVRDAPDPRPGPGEAVVAVRNAPEPAGALTGRFETH